MFTQRLNRNRLVVPIATIAVYLLGGWPCPARAAGGRAPAADPAVLVKAVLTPYLTAHAYKGTCTTTVVNEKAHTNVTTTTFLQARCDENGNIVRLRAQVTSWGQRNGADVTGDKDQEILYNGKTAWIYLPDTERYRQSSRKPPQLTALLELPPMDAAWTFAPRQRDDLPTERAVRAHVADEDWTLTLDSATGHLLRIAHSSGAGAQRTETTTVIRDLAFDNGADMPDVRYAFSPPSGAQEDTAVVAQGSASPLP